VAEIAPPAATAPSSSERTFEPPNFCLSSLQSVFGQHSLNTSPMLEVLQLSSSQKGAAHHATARYRVRYPDSPPQSPRKRSAASIEAVQSALDAGRRRPKRKRESSPLQGDAAPVLRSALGPENYWMNAAQANEREDVVTTGYAKPAAVERSYIVSLEQRSGRS
jgi:hypothetical protein